MMPYRHGPPPARRKFRPAPYMCHGLLLLAFGIDFRWRDRLHVQMEIEPQIANDLGVPKPQYMAIERERRWL